MVFLITYHDIIFWDKIQDGNKIKRDLNEQLRQLGFNLKTNDRSELLLELGKLIVKGVT